MNQADAHTGMRVIFGRKDGEQTLGRIVVVNATRAKVETLQARAGRPVGTRFNVPYALMRPAKEHQAPAT